MGNENVIYDKPSIGKAKKGESGYMETSFSLVQLVSTME